MSPRYLLLVIVSLVPISAIAEEFPISTATRGVINGLSTESAVATDGQVFLVAWKRVVPFELEPADSSVMLSRVRSDGELLDGTGIELARGQVGAPDVIFNGKDFLVAWSSSDGTFAARVNSRSELIGNPVRLGNSASSLAMEWATDRYLIAWVNHSRELRTFLLDGELNVVHQSTSILRQVSTLRAATDGDRFVLHYSDPAAEVNGNVLFVDRQGEMTFPGLLLPRNADVASNEEVFAFAYPGIGGVELLLTDHTGTVLRTHTVASPPAAHEVSQTSITADPSGFLIGYAVGDLRGGHIPEVGLLTNLYAVHTGNDGTPSAPPRALTNSVGTNHGLSLAWNGRDYFGVWMQSHELAPTDYSVRGSLITREGQALQRRGILDGRAISVGANRQGRAKIEWTGESYFATWSEYFWDWNEWRVMAGRITPTGELLDGAGVEIGRGGSFLSGAPFDFALDGARGLVTWTEGDHPNQRRMARFFSVNERIRLEPPFWALSFSRVLSNGSLFLLKAHDAFVRITPEGTVLDPGGRLLPASHVAGSELIATNGTDFLVVFTSSNTTACPEDECALTFAYVIDDEGTVGPLTRISSLHFGSAAVSDGSDYYLFHSAGETSNRDLFATRISTSNLNMIVGETAAVFTGPKSEASPHVDHDGSTFVVAWYELDVREEFRIGAGRMAQSTIIPYRLDPQPTFAGFYDVAAGPGQRPILAYAKYVNAPPSYTYRIMIQFLDEFGFLRRRVVTH